MSFGTTPRITKLMALAIKFNELVRTGQVKDHEQAKRVESLPKHNRVRKLTIFGILRVEAWAGGEMVNRSACFACFRFA